MLYRNTDHWNNLDNMRGLLFFVQRLDELTFPYTLDSYKSPTTSLLGLVYETISLMRDASTFGGENFDKSLNNIENLLAEIKFRLKGNWIAKRVCSISADDLVPTTSGPDKIDATVRQLKILAAELDTESYIAEIAGDIVELASSNKKIKIDFLAKELACFLQNKGVSRDHINKSIIEFFYSGQPVDNPNQLKRFLQIVYPHQHKFVVVAGLSDNFRNFDHEIIRNWDMIFVDANFSLIPEEELTDFRNEHEQKILVAIHTMATDYDSAASNALSKLESMHNFYRIFNHKSELIVSNHVLVEQGCCEGIRKKISPPNNNMHFIRDMRRVKAASTLRRFNEHITLDVQRDSVKFQNIINIHGMSLETKSEDIQLVNLWTCLETIAPSTRRGTKISNVVARIIPVLMLGYYNRLVVNLLFDVIRHDRRALSQVIKDGKFDKSADLKNKFIKILTDDDRKTDLASLYQACGDFELLKYRIYSLSNLLKTPAKAKEKLQTHEDMVKWQLHRIYRTRNRIVHSGESPQFTKYLVENAHDFFDQTFLFCLELSAWKKGFNDFISCFDYADRTYAEYKEVFKQEDRSLIVWTLQKNKDSSYIFSEII